MNLILVDRDTSKLADAKSAISSKGTVSTHAIDVSSLSDWSTLKSAVEKDGKKLDFLHLNAGIGLNGDWTDSTYFQKIFETNFFGVVNGINTFFPHFEANKNEAEQKAIIITGSKQGITNPPGTQPTTPRNPPSKPSRNISVSTSPNPPRARAYICSFPGGHLQGCRAVEG